MLEEADEFEVCADARHVDDAVGLAAEHRPDLAVVSVDDDHAAVMATQRLRAAHPAVRVVILSRDEQPFYAEAAVRAGARGYIVVDTAAGPLVDACRRAVAGEIVLSDTVVERLLLGLSDSRTRDASPSGTTLSAREAQVLELIGRGLMRREIAQRLELSAKTVDIYRERLRAKLHIDSLSELYRFAAQWVR